MANLKRTSINVIKRTNTCKVDELNCQSKFNNKDLFFSRKNAFGNLILIYLKCISIPFDMIRNVVLRGSHLGTQAKKSFEGIMLYSKNLDR